MFGNLRAKSSKLWKKKFQGLEVLDGKVPRFGNFGRKTSKVWKFCSEKFQGLELFDQKVPRFGNRAQKISEGAPASVGAGLEALEERLPGAMRSQLERISPQ